MAAKPEKKSTSWADEAEDEEPVAQTKPVWAKMHNWGASATPAANSAAPKGNYDKNFPPPAGGKDDFPPPSSSSKGPSQQQKSAPAASQPAPSSSAPRSARPESDDFRGPSSSSQGERTQRDYAPRDYPSRERRDNDYPSRDREEPRRNDDREGSFRRNDDSRGVRRGDDREDRRGDRRYDNDRRGGRDFSREAADRRDEREGFFPQTRRGDHRESHSDRHDDRRDDREDRRGGRNFDRRDDREERRGDDRKEHHERKEREPVPFPEAAPFTSYLANLSYDVNQQQLTEFFDNKGMKVESIKLPPGNEGAPNKGYAYVEFASLDDLKKAVENTGTTISGRPVKISVAEPVKERPKLNLVARSVPVGEENKKEGEEKGKSNPFGAAKPRDENAILQKKEEERKLREQKLKEEKEKEQPEETEKSETSAESPKETTESTPEKAKREEQKYYVPRKEGSGSGYKEQRGGRKGNDERSPKEGGERKPFERSDKPGGSFRGRGSDRGRRDGNRGGRGGFRDAGDRKREDRSGNAPKEQQVESFKAQHANIFDALGEDEE